MFPNQQSHVIKYHQTRWATIFCILYIFCKFPPIFVCNQNLITIIIIKSLMFNRLPNTPQGNRPQYNRRSLNSQSNNIQTQQAFVRPSMDFNIVGNHSYNSARSSSIKPSSYVTNNYSHNSSIMHESANILSTSNPMIRSQNAGYRTQNTAQKTNFNLKQNNYQINRNSLINTANGTANSTANSTAKNDFIKGSHGWSNSQQQQFEHYSNHPHQLIIAPSQIHKINQRQIQKVLLQKKYGNSIPTYLLKSGKFYQDEFKRSVVIDILKSSDGSQQNLAQLTRQASRRIDVHAHEIKIWIISFRMVFQVQNSMIKNGKDTLQQRLQKVNELMLKFMQNNKHQKKYRLVKIIQQLFKNLNLPDPKASGWINTFVQENKAQLQGIDFTQYNLQAIWRGFDDPGIKRDGRRRRGRRTKAQMNMSRLDAKNIGTKNNKDNQSQSQQQSDKNYGNIFYQKQSEQSGQHIKKQTWGDKQNSNNNNNNIYSNYHENNQNKQNQLISHMMQVARQRRHKVHDQVQQEDQQCLWNQEGKDEILEKQKGKAYKSKRQIMQQKKLQKLAKTTDSEEDEEIRPYPAPFKKNIASKIDEIIKSAINNAILFNASDLCLPQSTIIKIYKHYGAMTERVEFQDKEVGQISQKMETKPSRITRPRNRAKPISGQIQNGRIKPEIQGTITDLRSAEQLTNGKHAKIKPFKSLQMSVLNTNRINQLNFTEIQNSKNLYQRIENALCMKFRDIFSQNSSSQQLIEVMDRLEKQTDLMMEQLDLSENLRQDIKWRWMGGVSAKIKEMNPSINKFEVVSLHKMQHQKSSMKQEQNNTQVEQPESQNWILTENNDIIVDHTQNCIKKQTDR